MIKNQKSPKIIVAEVKMTRMIHNKAILVVEGVKDLRFWKVWKGIECELVCGEGKPNVEAGIAGLDSEGIGGVLGVVDDDYNAVLSHSAVSENVVSTDAHDLECLLCRSGAFRRVLAEFGDADKIERLEDREGMDVRSCLLRRAVVFGRLRAACMLIEFDVNVSAISVSRFVDRRTWNVDEEGLIGAVADGGSAGEEQLVRQSISRLAVIDS